MAQPGFIFGAPGLAATPQELSDKRKAAYGMISRALGRAPKDVGEGLNAIGKALIARSMIDEAAKAQQAGLASGQQSAASIAALLGGGAPDTVTGGTGGAATAPAPPAHPAASAPAGPAAPASFSGGSQDFIAQMMPHAQRVSQATGIDPRIVVAQAALESAWGRRAPGNNFFGIKSHGQPGGNTFATTEVVNGQPVRTRDSFRAYGSMGESADGYGRFLQQNPRYRPMLQAQGLDAQIQALGASGYATDPNYAAKIRQIASGIQMPQGASPPPPADGVEGGDGMEGLAAPDLTGSFDTMRMAAPGPMDPRARSFDQIAQAGAGMRPSQAMAAAPSVDSMMMGQQVAQPMQAPMPVPRPNMPQAPMQAPMPMARPNIEPPPQAQPAMAQQPVPMGSRMNERDALMLLRDEQSLAPGEAQSLRAGLGGAPSAAPMNPIQMVARALGGQPPAPASQAAAPPSPAVAQVAAAMQAQPQAAPATPPAAGAAPQAQTGQQRVAAAMAVLNNPWSPPGAQAAAQSVLQQTLTPQAPTIVPEGARVIDRSGREIVSATPRETDDIRNYNAYVRQEIGAGRTPLSQFEWGQQRRRAGATQVNVGGDNKQIFDAMNESATAARAAATGLNSLREARSAVQGGAILGAGADTRLALQKIGAALGVADTGPITSTETFRSAIAPQVAAMMKATVGSTQISNADREFAQQAAGGSINLDKTSILRLLDIMERASNVVIDDHARKLDQVYPEGPNVVRERALFSVRRPDMTPPAATQAAPAASGGPAEGATATNPQTGQRLQYRGGQWVPMQ